MTDYTSHADSLFDVGRPILGSVALEARDNVIATAEGAVGAPVVNVQALGKFTAGDTRRFYDGSTYTTTSASTTTVYSQEYWGAGVLRLNFEGERGSTSANVNVLVNGVTIHTVSLTSSFAAYTFDITLALGDTLSLTRVTGNNGGSVRYIELLTNGEQLLPFGGGLGGWNLV